MDTIEGQLFAPEREALMQRMRLLEDSFVMRGMFFSSSIEIVQRLAGEEAAASVAADAGVSDVKFSTMRKYPMRDFMNLEFQAASRLEPILGSFENALARVGGSAVEIFYESVAGRTMKLLGGQDPHRLMGAAPNAYPLTYTDAGSREYERVGERAGVFRFTGDVLGPCHQVGVFSTAVKLACEVDARITLEQPSLCDFVLNVSW